MQACKQTNKQTRKKNKNKHCDNKRVLAHYDDGVAEWRLCIVSFFLLHRLQHSRLLKLLIWNFFFSFFAIIIIIIIIVFLIVWHTHTQTQTNRHFMHTNFISASVFLYLSFSKWIQTFATILHTIVYLAVLFKSNLIVVDTFMECYSFWNIIKQIAIAP